MLQAGHARTIGNHMKPLRFFRAFVAVLIVTAAGDFAWHNWLLKDFYFSQLELINGTALPEEFPPFIVAAIVLSSLGTTYFVLSAPKMPDVLHGAARGALLGLMMAGVLNLVNHQLILEWSLTVASVDILWALVLGAAGGAVCVWAAGTGKKR